MTLDKILAGKAVAVTPFIDEIDQGMGGGSTPQDLETMFQLLYLRFTQPRADPTAFAAMASQARALLANQMASPDVVFNQAIDAALSRNSPRRQPETPATVDQWNLAKSLAFYKARFADASNFTFVFVGSFTPEAIKPLVETYIASLPATHAHETWRDLGIAPPTGVVEKTIQKGIAPKSQVAIVFSGPVRVRRCAQAGAADDDAPAAVAAARHDPAGARRHLQHHRHAGHARSFPGRNTACGSTGRAIRRARRRSCSASSRRSSSSGPRRSRQDQMALIRDALLREFERNSQDNGYLLNQIARRYEDGDAADVAAVDNLPEQIAALTGDAIQQAAQTYLNTGNYVKVTLMPETK